jgi:hypothetical protein
MWDTLRHGQQRMVTVRGGATPGFSSSSEAPVRVRDSRDVKVKVK